MQSCCYTKEVAAQPGGHLFSLRDTRLAPLAARILDQALLGDRVALTDELGDRHVDAPA